jgi:hypothetical protein
MINPSEEAEGQADYVSYLPRLWRGSDEGAVWRASLQSPHTGERVGFASLEKLHDFLRRKTWAVQDAHAAQDAGRERGGGDATGN